MSPRTATADTVDRRQGKSLVRMTVDRWGPIATGGFPAHLATRG